MDISAVVPVYNEEESVPVLNKRLFDALSRSKLSFEIIYVNDASSDCSREILNKIASSQKNTRCISFKENRGQSAALSLGFKEAQGIWIITLDADCQNPPEEIDKLLKLRNSYDFITGVRMRRQDTIMKKLSSKIALFFRKLVLGDSTRDTGCSLRLFKKEIVEKIPLFINFHRFFTFLVREAGFSIVEVEVGHNKRDFGKSKYNNFRRGKEGLFDLWGVYWLRKRVIKYKIQ
ncbi:MAG: glycosyltransferase family 2 protein [Candidatus Omnitrophota bacterium]